MIKTSCFFLLLLLLSTPFATAQNEVWLDECKSSRIIGTLRFTFPSNVGIDQRNHYIQKNLNCIEECLNIINEHHFTDSVEVEFLKDRNTMKKYLGWPASGMAYPDRKTMFCIMAEKTPIKHEWMHMIAMLKWGTPDQTLTWINEGLATYADKCSGYSNEEIYTYFIQSKKLINIDNLIHDFYKQNDIISYFQAAYLVEYLIEKYGIPKFKLLWKSNITEFEKIYDKPLNDIVNEINNDLGKKYTEPVKFDWNEFEKGCY